MVRRWLCDNQWQRVESMLPGKLGAARRSEKLRGR
jgi:hypothetical protein